MTLPGFTAEAALKKSEGRYRNGGYVATSTNGTVILPAMKRQPRSQHGQGSVRSICGDCGGTFWPYTGPGTTYGCVCPNADSGIVCGGRTRAQALSCDLWGDTFDPDDD
jgi:hypothetical protein